MNRLFVAVWPPPTLTARLRELDRPPQSGVRWTTENQWHVTLRFLGETDAGTEEALRQSLDQVAAETSGFEVEAGPGTRALGAGVWILPVEGLDPLATRVGAATRDLGEPPPHRPYRGHLTLARTRRPGHLRGLAEVPLEARWIVNDITLVRSTLRADGARYEVTGRWELGRRSG